METKHFVGLLKSRIELIGKDEAFAIVHNGDKITYMNRMAPYGDKFLLVEQNEEEDFYWFGEWKIHPSWIRLVSMSGVSEVTLPDENTVVE